MRTAASHLGRANYYDRVKAAVAHHQSAPPYHVAVYELGAEIDLGAFEASFFAVLEVNAERFSRALAPEQGRWEEATFRCQFVRAPVASGDSATMVAWLQERFEELVADSNAAPIICVVAAGGGRTSLGYLFNHVHGDGASGGIFHRAVCRIYNARGATAEGDDARARFAFLSDRALLERASARWSLREKARFVASLPGAAADVLLRASRFGLVARPAVDRSRPARLMLRTLRIERRALTRAPAPPGGPRASAYAILCAAMAKAFSVQAAGATHERCSFMVPVDLRPADDDVAIYGNHIGLVQVDLDCRKPLAELANEVQRQVSDARASLRPYASYVLSYAIASQLPSAELFASFARSTRKAHLLTSSLGYLGLDARLESPLAGAPLNRNDWFNYPGQGELGLSVCVSYTREAIHVGVAALSSHLDEGELAAFLTLLHANATGGEATAG